MPLDDASSAAPSEENPMVPLVARLRRLNEAIVTHQLSSQAAAALADQVSALTEQVLHHPAYTKAEVFATRDRVAAFLETGRWPDPPPDGDRLEFDDWSPVGGQLNPCSLGARYFRDGNEAVCRIVVGRAFEGPPERVHGGIICAIFDEVMGSVFRATGIASAFTGELSVRFEAPAPLGVELEFRARLVESSGRKRFLAAEGTSAAGRFASATGTFIEMRPEQFLRPQVPAG